MAVIWRDLTPPSWAQGPGWQYPTPAALNGLLYFCAYDVDSNPVFGYYDPDTDSFTQLTAPAAAPTDVYNLHAFPADANTPADVLVLFCGGTQATYDPDTDTWTDLPSLPADWSAGNIGDTLAGLAPARVVGNIDASVPNKLHVLYAIGTASYFAVWDPATATWSKVGPITLDGGAFPDASGYSWTNVGQAVVPLGPLTAAVPGIITADGHLATSDSPTVFTAFSTAYGGDPLPGANTGPVFGAAAWNGLDDTHSLYWIAGQADPLDNHAFHLNDPSNGSVASIQINPTADSLGHPGYTAAMLVEGTRLYVWGGGYNWGYFTGLPVPPEPTSVTLPALGRPGRLLGPRLTRPAPPITDPSDPDFVGLEPIPWSIDVRDLSDLSTVVAVIDSSDDEDDRWGFECNPGARLSDVKDFLLSVPEDSDARAALEDTDAVVVFTVAGQVIWAGQPKELTRYPVAQGEEGAEIDPVKGADLGVEMDRYVVYPTLAIGKKPWGRNRDFSFASPEYDASGWGSASVIIERNGDPSTYWTGKPSGMPAKDIPWIGPPGGSDGAAPQGSVYLILDISLDSDSILRWFIAADNGGDFFFQGFRTNSIDPAAGDTTTGFVKTTQGAIAASAAGAGTVRLAFKLINTDFAGLQPDAGAGPTLGGNPTGFLGIGFLSDSTGQLLERAWQTSAAWACLAYPDVPPGLTGGHILRIIKAENEGYGLDIGLNVDFTDLADSDGQAMPPIELFTAKVGDSMLKAARDLGQTFIDWRIDYSTFTLQCWEHGQGGNVSGVVYKLDEDTDSPIVQNLTDLQIGKRLDKTDSLLVEFTGGHVRVPETGGTSTRFLSQPGASRLTAIDVANQELDRAQQDSIKIQVAPTGNGDIPGLHVKPGDILTIDAGDAGTFELRLLEWQATITDDGLEWALTVGNLILPANERLDRIIQRYSNGSLGGKAASGPAEAPPKFGNTGGSSKVSFRYDGYSNDPQQPPDDQNHEAGNVYSVTVVVTDPSTDPPGPASGPITFTVEVNGVDILDGAGYVPTGAKEVEIPVAPPAVGKSTWWIETTTLIRVTVTNSSDCNLNIHLNLV